MAVENGVVAESDMSFELAFDASVKGEEFEAPEPEPVADPEPEPVAAEPAPVVDPHEEERARIKQLEAEMLALKAEKEEKEKQAAAPVEEKPLLTEDEQAFLEEYGKEWGDGKRALELHKKIMEAEFEKRLAKEREEFQKLVAANQANLAPFVQTAESIAQEKFVAEVTAKHPDAKAIMPEVEKWVATLPASLKVAYDKVLDNGSAVEVIEVFSMFKQMTGRTTPTTEEKAKETQIKEDRLARLEGVKSERTGITAEPDPNDFDAAFAQAVKQRK